MHFKYNTLVYNIACRYDNYVGRRVWWGKYHINIEFKPQKLLQYWYSNMLYTKFMKEKALMCVVSDAAEKLFLFRPREIKLKTWMTLWIYLYSMNVAVQVKYNRMPKLCSKIVLNVYMCLNWKLCTYAKCSQIFFSLLLAEKSCRTFYRVKCTHKKRLIFTYNITGERITSTSRKVIKTYILNEHTINIMQPFYGTNILWHYLSHYSITIPGK